MENNSFEVPSSKMARGSEYHEFLVRLTENIQVTFHSTNSEEFRCHLPLRTTIQINHPTTRLGNYKYKIELIV